LCLPALALRWLPELNVRQGFFENTDFEKVLSTGPGTLTYGAPTRTVSELAGCGLETVVKAQGRLRQQGWLKLVTGAHWREGRANVWALAFTNGA
jgi:hypothetical protein